MDTFITIETWDGITGGWYRDAEEPKNITAAVRRVRELDEMSVTIAGEHGTYRIMETKVVAIWEDGDEVKPVDKLSHRGCTL